MERERERANKHLCVICNKDSKTSLWRTSEKEKSKISKNQKPHFNLALLILKVCPSLNKPLHELQRVILTWKIKKLSLLSKLQYSLPCNLRTGALSRYFQINHVRRESWLNDADLKWKVLNYIKFEPSTSFSCWYFFLKKVWIRNWRLQRLA